MSLRKLILLFLLMFLCQTSAVNLIRVAGATPNLVLCLAIPIVFYYNDGKRAWPIALVAALLVDMAGAHYTGVGALSLCAALLVVMLFRVHLNTDNPLALEVTAAVAVCLYEIVYWGLMWLLRDPMSFSFMAQGVWKSGVYDLVLIAVIYILLSRKKPLPDSNNEILLDGVESLMPLGEEVEES